MTPDIQANDAPMAGDLIMEADVENMGGFPFDGNGGGMGDCKWLTFGVLFWG